MIPIKMILLGNPGVGKTSLMYRFLYGNYYDMSVTVSLLYYVFKVTYNTHVLIRVDNKGIPGHTFVIIHIVW